MSQSTTSYGRRGTKRARSSTGPRTVRTMRQFQRSIPRSLNSRSLTQRNVHPVTGQFVFDLTVDNGIGFAFDTLGAYINSTISGTQFFAINGLTELSGVYEILRLVKVEFTVMASANALDMSATSTGSPFALPILYAGPDYNDNDVPTLNIMNQNPLTTTHRMDKVIRKTVYCKMEGSNGVIDVGANQRNLFQQAGIASTQQWHGMKFFIDMTGSASSAFKCTIAYKCFYEAMYAK